MFFSSFLKNNSLNQSQQEQLVKKKQNIVMSECLNFEQEGLDMEILKTLSIPLFQIYNKMQRGDNLSQDMTKILISSIEQKYITKYPEKCTIVSLFYHNDLKITIPLEINYFIACFIQTIIKIIEGNPINLKGPNEKKNLAEQQIPTSVGTNKNVKKLLAAMWSILWFSQIQDPSLSDVSLQKQILYERILTSLCDQLKISFKDFVQAIDKILQSEGQKYELQINSIKDLNYTAYEKILSKLENDTAFIDKTYGEIYKMCSKQIEKLKHQMAGTAIIGAFFAASGGGFLISFVDDGSSENFSGNPQNPIIINDSLPETETNTNSTDNNEYENFLNEIFVDTNNLIPV
jgi:hypothetical protein